MDSILAPLLAPLRTLLVAVVGVLLAWFWFRDLGVLAVGIAVVGVITSMGLDYLGRKQLPNHPVAAVQLMEWWLLAPLMLAAVGSAVVIVIAIALALPDEASDQTKELVGALAAGITAFVTSGFISWTGDQDDSTLADHIQSIFETTYLDYSFQPKNAERWVYSESFEGVNGWGRQARLARAKGVSAALKKPAA